jgi:hypothetical protein
MKQKLFKVQSTYQIFRTKSLMNWVLEQIQDVDNLDKALLVEVQRQLDSIEMNLI